MRLFLSVVCALMLTACERPHENWLTYTGTSADRTSRLPLMPAATQPGQFPLPTGFQLAGCLAGANDDFTLTDGNTGTIYRVQGTPDELKLHVGETVALAGRRSGNAGGVPWFRMERLQTLGVNCPVVAQGGINELNRPPSEKLGVSEAEVLPNPENKPGQPAKGASVTGK